MDTSSYGGAEAIFVSVKADDKGASVSRVLPLLLPLREKKVTVANNA